MKKLWMIGLVALGACAAWWGRPEVVAPVAVTHLTVAYEYFADSTVATVGCGTAAWRASQNLTACRWTNGQVGGVPRIVPDGFTSRFTLVGAEGDSVQAGVSGAGLKVVNAQEYVGPYRAASWPMKIGVALPTAPDTLIVTIN